MVITTNKGRYKYWMERVIAHVSEKNSVQYTFSDTIKLVKVFDIRKDEYVDITEHRAKMSLRDWDDLIKITKYHVCSICEAFCQDGQCENRRFHMIPPKKK